MVRLLLLLSVLLMPFGMAPAAASHHAMAAAMTVEHCPYQAPQQQHKRGVAECTMACAAALPAIDRAATEIGPILAETIAASAPQRLHGLHPDTVTPPPKLT